MKDDILDIAKNRILIIQDEEYPLYTMATAFLQAGFRVDTQNHGNKALELIKKNKYIFVIIDLDLEDMDALEFRRQATAMYPTAIELPLLVILPKNKHNALTEFNNFYTITAPITLEKLSLKLSKINPNISKKFRKSIASLTDLEINAKIKKLSFDEINRELKNKAK